MTVRHLDALFAPRSIAVIGASNRPHSIGSIVMRNLLRAGFPGAVLPVNPKHEAVAGVLAYPDVARLPEAPDLAVICTPPASVPGIVGELGARGTRAAIVITAGLSQLRGADGADLAQHMLRAAKPHCLRILGPNCIGLLVPRLSLNASFAPVDALPGAIAFVSQSGALCTAALDWARSRGIGFSHFVSLGNSSDIDVGDVLDWLGADPSTRSILLYLESVPAARKFMSAARAAARNKPVIVIKAGRAREGAAAAATHTGALAGADAVFDAAFRRAGMLRVDGLDEIFDAAETLTRTRLVGGDRLLILTNGGGPGVMATDALIAAGGRLADLPDELRRELDAVLPPTWSRANPVDIVGDAPASRFTDALRVLLARPPGDALLVMNSPTAVVPGDEAARAVAEAVAAASTHPIVLASWLGGESVEGGRRLLREAGVATFDTPGDAVRAFLHMVAYRRNQDQLMEVPPALPADFEVHPAAAREVIEKAAGAGRDWLSEPESKQVLAAYGIPVVPTRHAASAEEAVRLAAEMGLPVALKILSPQVTHKTEVGGVALDLETPEAVRAAAGAMAGRLRQLRPEAQLEGFAVQPMARRPGAHELILGAATDAVFGPVLLFGHGGTGVEVIGDRAVGLPPLNLALARDLVSRTRVARLLDGYRGRPAADRAALELALVRLSQLLVDLPEVLEVDVNPLLADEKGVLALDARLRVAPPGSRRAPLAVRPYPGALEENLELPGGRRVFVRPIRPEDEPSHRRFFERLAPSDVYFRFFSMVRRMPHSQLARFTQIDYDREMAFIALDAPAGAETLGVVRVVCDPDNTRGEFAIVVRSDLKGRGLGHALLEKMIRYCRERRTGVLVGQVLPDNRAMLALAAELGFESRYDTEGGIVEVELRLSPAPAG